MVIVIINLLGLFMPRARIKGGGLSAEEEEERSGEGEGRERVVIPLVIRHSKEDRRPRRVNQSVDEIRGVQRAP